MYFVVSWDISAVNPRWSQIDKELLNCLAGYTYVRPVNTFYMVKITSAAQIVTFQACLTAVAKKTTEKITFIISPAFSSHVWSGMIDNWASVNAITNP